MEIHEQATKSAWMAGLSHIKRSGHTFTDRESRVCKEVLNLIIAIEKPKEDILAPISYLTSLDLWVYPSLEELENIIFARKTIPTIQYTYGSRIFNFANQVDQVHDFIIPLLRADPTSRRAVISTWNPVRDSRINNKEIPSLLSIFFKVRDGKLDATGTIRSNDLFIGWPTNVYQLWKLQELVAEELGLPPGRLTTISNSAHYFEEYNPLIEKLIAADSRL